VRRGRNSATRAATVSRSAQFCARLKLFNRLGSFFCNSRRLRRAKIHGVGFPPLEIQRRRCGSPWLARCRSPLLRSSPLSTHEDGRPTVSFWTVKSRAEDEVERLFRSEQAARSRPASDQPRRGDLSGSGGFICDLSGPPAAVGVLDGGSLAGNDSSSSSSSFSSGFDCGLVGGDFRGSFIPASPWGSPCSHRA
jgi:hypothetical protein